MKIGRSANAHVIECMEAGTAVEVVSNGDRLHGLGWRDSKADGRTLGCGAAPLADAQGLAPSEAQ